MYVNYDMIHYSNLFGWIGSKVKSAASFDVGSPAHAVHGVGPEQISERTLERHLNSSVDELDLVERFDLIRKTSMHA
jgi:hypothetical protein